MAELTQQFRFVLDVSEVVNVRLGEFVGGLQLLFEEGLLLGKTTVVRTMPSSTA